MTLLLTLILIVVTVLALTALVVVPMLLKLPASVSRWRSLERQQGDARPGPLGGR